MTIKKRLEKLSVSIDRKFNDLSSEEHQFLAYCASKLSDEDLDILILLNTCKRLSLIIFSKYLTDTEKKIIRNIFIKSMQLEKKSLDEKLLSGSDKYFNQFYKKRENILSNEDEFIKLYKAKKIKKMYDLERKISKEYNQFISDNIDTISKNFLYK